MATTILRPDSTTSETGWNASNIHLIIGDENAATGPTQNSTTCNWTGTLSDLDGSLSGATINSFTISLTGKAGRAGASTVAMIMVHSSDGPFASENESFSGGASTETTSARTTQQDGSSALTFTYINDCSLKMDPNTQGIQVFEYFVTVDYDLDPSGIDSEQGYIKMEPGKGVIRLTSGVIVI
tara:strand:+ start:862 stop:1410 length:549 start_codon:yes stop_codon:yes gene_type:complete